MTLEAPSTLPMGTASRIRITCGEVYLSLVIDAYHVDLLAIVAFECLGDQIC